MTPHRQAARRWRKACYRVQREWHRVTGSWLTKREAGLLVGCPRRATLDEVEAAATAAAARVRGPLTVR